MIVQSGLPSSSIDCIAPAQVEVDQNHAGHRWLDFTLEERVVAIALISAVLAFQYGDAIENWCSRMRVWCRQTHSSIVAWATTTPMQTVPRSIAWTWLPKLKSNLFGVALDGLVEDRKRVIVLKTQFVAGVRWLMESPVPPRSVYGDVCGASR